MLCFFGPYRRSSEDDKHSFVKFTIIVGGEIYGARGSSLYLMTGTRDVTTCTDIVYGKHFRTQISLISTKNISQVPVPGRALLENGILYRDSDFTVA